MPNTYSNKFDNLCIHTGEFPAGKILDIDATDKRLQAEIDRLDAEWLEKYPEPDRESPNYDAWEDCQRAEHDQMCIRLVESENWYDNAYVWIEA